MVASAAATPSGSRARAPPKTAPAQGRVTRLRSAKSEALTPGPAPNKPAGLLARGKAELRKVSDKIKEGKEKEKEKEKDKDQESKQRSSHGSSTESLKAYLRIRPTPFDAEGGSASVRPYLEIQNDKEVLMRAPTDHARPTIPKASLIYSFDKVYSPSTLQSSFFSTTTMPLVESLLMGENGLLFAYGVSNSGKTYTISGGSTEVAEERGLLPRAMDVIFNSIDNHQCDMNLRCSGFVDVEITEADESAALLANLPMEPEARSAESIKVDKNFSYAVFISYAEVYNDKIFDLLETAIPSSPPPKLNHSRGPLPRGSSMYPLHSTMNLAAVANGGGGVIKRRVLQLKPDPDGNGKYISGLSEIRVRTREEALAVFRAGQRARQVFGTMANRESSRSHGIFTTKVVRIHNGAPEDPESIQVSRLAIVDLAGSERTKNTQTTGDRLKEAGNINRSLMVLGQCLEVLRSNQQKLSAPVPPGTKKKLEIVPFRHSKLTEIFQNFFVGDGRAVMIVNVNPYDTGFDENSHVMRFSAVAREVQTTASNKVTFPTLKRQISTQFSAFKHAVSGSNKIKVVVPVLPKLPEGQKVNTKTLSGRVTDDYVMVEEEIEVVEEGDEESEDERDMLVESLFDQLRELKTRLYEAEMRNATIEVEVREEVAQEMHQTITKMSEDFQKRLQNQVMASEVKTDRKIDIVSRMATPSAARFRAISEEMESPNSVADNTMTTQDSETTGGDESFVSALNVSNVSSEDGPIRQARISDPFIVKRVVPTVVITRQSGSLGSNTEREVSAVLETSDEESPIATRFNGSKISTREGTAESEDVLAQPMIDRVVASSSKVGNETITTETDLDQEESDQLSEDEATEEEEDEKDEEGFEGEEDIDDDVDAAADEASYEEEADEEDSAADSSFSFSEPEGFSSEDESPVRRASTRRRTTGSPKKKISPVKPASSATKPAVAKSKTAREMIAALASPSSDASSSGVLPLRERKGQDQQKEKENNADEEEDVVITSAVKPKKKRVLGKKVVEVDEDALATPSMGGGEVKRLVRGAF